MRGDRQNLKLVALGRHAEYKGDLHTEEGRAKLRLAVAWLAKYMQTLGVTIVYMATTKVNRAIEAAEFYRAAFARAGLNIVDLGQCEGLNPIHGPRGAQKRVAREYMGKSYGKGFMKLWRGRGDQLIPGMEKYATVAERTSVVYEQLRAQSTEPKAALVIVGHGGVFEPMADKVFGAKVNDIPQAGIVLFSELNIELNPFSDYNVHHIMEDGKEGVAKFNLDGKYLSGGTAIEHISNELLTYKQLMSGHCTDD